MIYDQRKARQQYQNAVNNAQGHHFEGYIKAGCLTYKDRGRGKIEKISEPFKVTETHRDGRFTGRFTSNAEPDFQGTLSGGRSIVFEAKYTSTERMKRGVLTGDQIDALQEHAALGALAGVCIGIQDKFYFIPWDVWRDMKSLYGRQYITAADVEEYRVKFNGAVLFLDYMHKERRERDGEKETQTENDGQGYAADGIQP